MPGATSRWNRGKDLSWEPLRIERVAEVAYDHLQGDRFRHATTFARWRPDKQPADCRYDQLETNAPYELERIFGLATVISAPNRSFVQVHSGCPNRRPSSRDLTGPSPGVARKR